MRLPPFLGWLRPLRFEFRSPYSPAECLERLRHAVAHPWAFSSKLYSGDIHDWGVSVWDRRAWAGWPWPIVLVAALAPDDSGARMAGKVRPSGAAFFYLVMLTGAAAFLAVRVVLVAQRDPGLLIFVLPAAIFLAGMLWSFSALGSHRQKHRLVDFVSAILEGSTPPAGSGPSSGSYRGPKAWSRNP